MELVSLACAGWTQRWNVLHRVWTTDCNTVFLLYLTLHHPYWTLPTVHWSVAVCSAALRPAGGACPEVTGLLAAVVKSSRISNGVLTGAAEEDEQPGLPSPCHHLTETLCASAASFLEKRQKVTQHKAWLPLSTSTIKQERLCHNFQNKTTDLRSDQCQLWGQIYWAPTGHGELFSGRLLRICSPKGELNMLKYGPDYWPK